MLLDYGIFAYISYMIFITFYRRRIGKPMFTELRISIFLFTIWLWLHSNTAWTSKFTLYSSRFVGLYFLLVMSYYLDKRLTKLKEVLKNGKTNE
jgi:hypothetical protein